MSFTTYTCRALEFNVQCKDIYTVQRIRVGIVRAEMGLYVPHVRTHDFETLGGRVSEDGRGRFAA